MTVSAIPEAFHSLTPYVICDDANAAIAFIKRLFRRQRFFA